MRTPIALLAPLILALLALAPHEALALTPLDAGEMEARVLITNTVAFVPEGTRSQVSEATGTLTWFPREDALQQVRSIEATPSAQRTDESFVFSWVEPASREDVMVEAVVRTRNGIVPVTRKIPFPLRDVPDDMQQYLEDGEIADQSAQIQRLAQELAAGKDDAYEVVFALADWTTTNVNYSLASLRAPAIQKSSEVIESRWGKCDELTALFISLNRALGIPARFVAGYSYTNSDLIQEEWGGHGWAEVWLPGVGWVPFDVTYGEYGYLDAGHVKLKVAADPKETSIDYAARGSGFTLRTQPLDIYVTPLDLEASSAQTLDIELEAPYTQVGFGSAVLILARVRNTQDHYVSTRLDLAQTSNTEMLSDTYKNVLLRPLETRTVPFLVRIDQGLERGYRYEFPFQLSSRLGERAHITIDVEPDAPVYGAREFDEIIEKYQGARIASAPFSVTCGRASAYAGEPLTHECTVEGAVGDTLRVCDERKACAPVALDGERFPLEAMHEDEGMHTGVYTATALGRTTTFFATARVVEPASVSIELSHPANMTPGDEVVVEALVSRTGAQARDVQVTLEGAHATSTTERIESMSAPARVRFSLPGRALRPGDNAFTVRVTYVDELGTAGESTAQGSIALVDVGMLDRFAFWVGDAGTWISGLFS